jgi:hypothetical protein
MFSVTHTLLLAHPGAMSCAVVETWRETFAPRTLDAASGV